MEGDVTVPHATKITRKSDSVGIELRNLACGETSIILQIKIMERMPCEIKNWIWDVFRVVPDSTMGRYMW